MSLKARPEASVSEVLDSLPTMKVRTVANWSHHAPTDVIQLKKICAKQIMVLDCPSSEPVKSTVFTTPSRQLASMVDP